MEKKTGGERLNMEIGSIYEIDPAKVPSKTGMPEKPFSLKEIVANGSSVM